MANEPAPQGVMAAEPPRGGVANPGVIDLFGLDVATDQVLLVMQEARPWEGGDAQLHDLQEKFNAYASFILDGEMLTAHPEVRGKLTRIELRCAYYPSERALALLEAIHDQLEFQEIALQVTAPPSAGCGDHCTCAPPEDELGSC